MQTNTTTTKKTRKGSTRKQAKAKTTKTATRKTARVAEDAEIQIERIAGQHGDAGHAALNFFFTINYTPAFLRDAAFETLDRAAGKLNLPPFDKEGDDVEQFTRLVNLFEAASEEFSLSAPDVTSGRDEGNEFTYEQARAYGHHLGMKLGGEESDIGDALLVFRALVYSERNEDLLHELTAGIMPLASSFDKSVRTLVRRQADDWDRMYPPQKAQKSEGSAANEQGQI